MAGSLNKVMLLGNLGRDPEIRSMQNGGRLANLSIATSERWKDREGNPRERTEWHRIVIFAEGLVGVVERYLKKGSKVYIEGALQTRKWTDKETGQDKYATEVVLQAFGGKLIMLDSRGGAGGGGGGAGGGDEGGYGDYGDGGRATQQSGVQQDGGQQGQHQGGQGGQQRGGGVGADDALDDDIPF